MALIIYVICLIPLIFVRRWQKNSLVNLYLIAAAVSIIVFIPLHVSLNKKADPEGKYKKGLYLFKMEAGFTRQVTGSYVWRFFDWGVLEGQDVTAFNFWLTRKHGFDMKIARRIDVINPTPCILVTYLLILGVFCHIFYRELPGSKP